MTELNRRQALQMIAAVPAAASLPMVVLPDWIEKAAHAAQEAIRAGDFVPVFFTPAEWDIVRMLPETIIPADVRFGGALAAGVPEFMDFTMNDRPSNQQWMRDGLRWIDEESVRRFNVGFVFTNDAERARLLDAIAFPARASADVQQGVEFFNRFRDLTATGYFSSRVGVEYLGYIGNAFNPQWRGCPPEAQRHLGV
jgi:gluconate 2-dehydrogenase gamma chain